MPKVYDRLAKSFNDPVFSDLTFTIDDKHIYVQKLYLKSVCKQFFEMFIENNENEIIITQYSYSVFHSFLKYLYTNLFEIKPEDATDLLNLAISCSEEDLKHECIETIKDNITIKNVCQTFSFAFKFNLQQLLAFCIDFAKNKMIEICNTFGYINMQQPVLREFIARVNNYK